MGLDASWGSPRYIAYAEYEDGGDVYKVLLVTDDLACLPQSHMSFCWKE